MISRSLSGFYYFSTCCDKMPGKDTIEKEMVSLRFQGIVHRKGADTAAGVSAS